MGKRKVLIFTLFLSVPLLASCISSNTSSVGSSQKSPMAVAGDDDQAAMASVPRISVAEANALVQSNRATIFDVRAEAAYRSAHIKGSISLPEVQVLSRISTLPRDKKIIAYCT